MLKKQPLQFSHRANKTIEGMSWKTAMVIEALKALGKNRADERVIQKLRKQLSKSEKATLLSEARQTTNWIFSIIKKICAE